MSPQLILTMAGLLISVASLSMVAPSIVRALDAKQAEVGLSREESLVQHIIQFRTLEGSYPSTVADLVAKNYWSAANNNNGFGGAYTFTVDGAKGLITIRTTIADTKNRALYMSTFKRTFKAVDEGGGSVRTTFVMPTIGSMGAPIQGGAGGKIPASATAPDAASNKFWYDTSGATAVMKVSTGSAWVASTTVATSTSTAPSSSNILSDAGKLPTTAANGDVRYIYNAAAGTLDTLAYFNGAWSQVVNSGTAVGNANGLVVSLTQMALPFAYAGEAFSFDFKSIISATSTATGAPITVDKTKTKWTVMGALPTGMSFDAVNGVLSGTPPTKTGIPPAGQQVNVVATYSGTYGQQTFPFYVGPALAKGSKVAVGQYNGCLIAPDGGAQCWGYDGYGSTGALPAGTNKVFPTQVQGIAAGSGATNVTVGMYATCALISGAAKCWGGNSSGELGDGTTNGSTTPVQVTGLTSGVKSLSAGDRLGCAVTSAGGVKCWGMNTYGQLGIGTTDYSAHGVTDVTGLATGTVAVGAAGLRACALMSTGGVKCWGDSFVGNNTTNKYYVPTDASVLGSGSPAKALAVGNNTACVIMNSGGVKCWGNNAFGAVGINGGNVLVPTDIPELSPGVVSLSIGTNHGCAVMTAGGIKCWGSNQYGAVGVGTVGSTYWTPVDVVGITDAVYVSAGKDNTCALRANGAVLCWGDNSYGQLGLANTKVTQTGTPTIVLKEAW